jgi:hypothetical protein
MERLMASPSLAVAYEDIKNLENNGTIQLPSPTDTILVGSIDGRTGDFTFQVPTFQQTVSVSTPPGAKPTPPVVTTVGVVATNCVNLTLAFEVTNAVLQGPKRPVTTTPVVNKEPVLQPSVATDPTSVSVAASTSIHPPSDPVLSSGLDDSGGASFGGVTISGFPSAGTQGTQILLNAGVTASSVIQDVTAPPITPPIEPFVIQITFNGQLSFQKIAILRPPVLGVGAFTIPALPVGIIFAPPQGQLAKNSNTFNDTVTTTTTTTVSVSNQNATKTAQAYTPGELAQNVGSTITQLAALGALLPGVSTTAGPASLISVISSLIGGQNQSFGLGDLLKLTGSGLTSFNTILTGIAGITSNSSTSSITTTTSNTLSVSMAFSETYGSTAGLGPGAGDRFVYFENVRAVWSNNDGDVGITVLGFDGVAAVDGSELIADQQALASGGTATFTNLDANTIAMLLSLDPNYTSNPQFLPPRFTPLIPPNVSGGGTSLTGDAFSVTNETISDTSTTNTSQTINVTDVKPGFIPVLFGSGNSETTTTVTATNTVTTDQKTDQKTSNVITFIQPSPTDTYNVNLYFDNLFQMLLAVEATPQPAVSKPAVATV